MAKGKLKAALENYKGVDYALEKQKRKAKEARKHKRAKRAKNGDAEEGTEEQSADEEEGGVLIDEEAVGVELAPEDDLKLKKEIQALLKDKKKLLAVESGDEGEEEDISEEEGWEDAEGGVEVGEDESEDEEDEKMV